MKSIWLAVFFAASAFAAEEGGHDVPVIYKWVNFAILAGILGYIAVKAGGPALRQRAEDILESFATAARRGQEVAAKAAEVEKKLAGLQSEIDAIRAEARDEMAREAERIAAETTALLAKVEHNAQQEITSAVKAAKKELQVHSSHVALDLARRKMQERITPAVQDGLVDGFIQTLN
jgi:F-type H+-transporting ATPase subunit b